MERISVDGPDAVERVTRLLDAGALCVLPTDTQYALVADALNDDAALRVLEVKRRPADQPLPVCVGGLQDVHHVAHTTPLARELADLWWPGPVTLLMKARSWLPNAITAGGTVVPVRCPANDFAQHVTQRFGPYVATSAKRHAQPIATDVDAALREFGGEVALYVDGGALGSVPSTLVDATGMEAKVLRDGAIPASEIAAHGPRVD